MSGTNRNLTDSLRFREAVALYFQLSGLTDARPRPMLMRNVLDSDIGGVGAHVRTSSRIAYRIGQDLDQAVQAAGDSGAPFGALIQHRSGRALADSLCVVRLEDFVGLLALAERAEVAT